MSTWMLASTPALALLLGSGEGCAAAVTMVDSPSVVSATAISMFGHRFTPYTVKPLPFSSLLLPHQMVSADAYASPCWMDIELSAYGVVQAKKIGDQMHALSLRFDPALTSVLRRAGHWI